MKRGKKTKTEPRIGRKDLQDPDRDVHDPREGAPEPDGRSDREAGAGRPVQLDEDDRATRRLHSPPPRDDAPPAK
ncbi:MAG TPA: hypothetical protein VJX92_01535 [Methylomirabilota bacterium]|nr:hypothetical protein [Methylomirabilota bacterium]